MFLVLSESRLRELGAVQDLPDAERKCKRVAENSLENHYILRAVKRRKAIVTVEEEDLCQD